MPQPAPMSHSPPPLPTPAPFPNLLDFRPEKLVLKSDGYTCPHLPPKQSATQGRSSGERRQQLLTTLNSSDTSSTCDQKLQKEPLS